MCIPHTHSENYFLGSNPSKRSFIGLQVSGVEIGLNEANLINDVHLVTSFCDVMFYVFISPEFPLSLWPFTRLPSCVSCVLLLKRHYSSYLSSPASFPLHDRDRSCILDTSVLCLFSKRYETLCFRIACLIIKIMISLGFISL